MCEQSELTTAGEGFIGSPEVKKAGGQASIVKFFPLLGEGLRERVLLEGRKLRRYDGRPLTVTNPFLPLLGKDKRMGNNQYPPQPSLIREGASCHCEEGVSPTWQSQNRDNNAILRFAQNDLAPVFVIADSEADPQSQDSEMLKHGGQSDVQDDTNPLPQSLPRGREVKIRSSRFTLHSSLKKRAAFTLAEVLITLGIIGVVAAMTIPTVIAKYQEAQLKAQFKKTYSTILQAMQYVAMENGGYIDCYYNGANTQKQCQPFYKQMAEHIKYVKYCPKNSYEQGCIPKYKSYHTGACYGYNEGAMNKRAFTYVLADGSLLISYDVGQEAIFAVDINGKKGPNDRGKDLFSFVIYKNDEGGYYIGDNITSCMNTSDNEYVYIDDMYK